MTQATYIEAVQQAVQDHWMPAQASSVKLVGVEFSVDARGRLVALAVTSSSGHAAMDEAALSAVRRAAPFKRFPDGMGNAEVAIRVTFVYEPADG